MSHALHLPQIPRRTPLLAFIVSFHALFLYMLNQGIHVPIAEPGPLEYVPLAKEPEPLPPQPQSTGGEARADRRTTPSDPNLVRMPEFLIEAAPPEGPLAEIGNDEAGPPATSVRVAPRIDPRHPLARPPYPPQAIRQELEGLVVVNACVRPDGRIAEVALKQSSGYRILDEAALKHLAKPGTRMLPGTEDGTPVTSCTGVPIRFQLER